MLTIKINLFPSDCKGNKDLIDPVKLNVFPSPNKIASSKKSVSVFNHYEKCPLNIDCVDCIYFKPKFIRCYVTTNRFQKYIISST